MWAKSWVDQLQSKPQWDANFWIKCGNHGFIFADKKKQFFAVFGLSYQCKPNIWEFPSVFCSMHFILFHVFHVFFSNQKTQKSHFLNKKYFNVFPEFSSPYFFGLYWLPFCFFGLNRPRNASKQLELRGPVALGRPMQCSNFFSYFFNPKSAFWSILFNRTPAFSSPRYQFTKKKKANARASTCFFRWNAMRTLPKKQGSLGLITEPGERTTTWL